MDTQAQLNEYRSLLSNMAYEASTLNYALSKYDAIFGLREAK